jgi:DNA gyrase subunit B
MSDKPRSKTGAAGTAGTLTVAAEPSAPDAVQTPGPVTAPAPASAPADGSGNGAAAPDDYTADSFSVVEGMAHIRKNPSMYIGGADEKGLHHLVWELVDNSIDEAMAGHCRNIHVAISADGSVSVGDDGRGIPVDINTKTGKTGLEIALTKVGGGAKHDNRAYQTSGGLHGMGLTCVNAVSAWLEAEVTRGGFVHRQRYERGEKMTELERLGARPGSGTKITFLPDREIFTAKDEQPAPEFRYETIEARLKQQAYLNPGVTIKLDDERAAKSVTFHFPQGIRDFVRDLNVGKEPILPDIMYFSKADPATGLQAEVAMQWTRDFKETVYSFANSIYTREGGTHLTGFRSALTRTVKGYMEREGHLKDKDKGEVTGEDVYEGLTAVVSCRVPGRTFESQTKVALTSSEARRFVEDMVAEQLSTRLLERPAEAKDISKRVQMAAEGRRAAQKARETIRKSAMGGFGLPGKLSDCQTKDRETAELFLVEGDSAGGSAKGARDSTTQAILPLRGKVLNIEKATIDKVLDHKEIQALITALGAGINITAAERGERGDRAEAGGNGANGAAGANGNGSGNGHGSAPPSPPPPAKGDMAFDLAKLRYGKIILMTDADVDGSHIRTLLLTFFFRHMPELIEAGKIYIAQPPLYGIRKRGKISQYVLNERKLREMLRDAALDDTVLVVRPSGDAKDAKDAKTPDGKAAERTLKGGDLKELLRLLDLLETNVAIVRRRGFLWPKFLADHYDPAAWAKDRRLLPTHHVVVDRKDSFFHTEEEFAAFLKTLPAASVAAPAAPAAAAPAAPASPASAASADGDGKAPAAGATPNPAAPAVRHTVLNECKQINEIFRMLAELAGLGLTPADYLLVRREGVDGTTERARFALSDAAGGDRPVEVANLADLPPAVSRVGGKGLELQRYKGLGEMDAEQLGETTMDPKKRTLLRVTLENAAEAERLFSTLMGKETDSRREFIEEHALEVRNLDV